MIYNITKTWTVTETLRISIQNLIIPEADQASSEIAFQVGFSHSVSLSLSASIGAVLKSPNSQSESLITPIFDTRAMYGRNLLA